MSQQGKCSCGQPLSYCLIIVPQHATMYFFCHQCRDFGPRVRALQHDAMLEARAMTAWKQHCDRSHQ